LGVQELLQIEISTAWNLTILTFDSAARALWPSTVETFPVGPGGIGLEYELQHGDGQTIPLHAVRDERRQMWLRQVLLLLPKPVGRSPLP
jgi:hypothetical protein